MRAGFICYVSEERTQRTRLMDTPYQQGIRMFGLLREEGGGGVIIAVRERRVFWWCVVVGVVVVCIVRLGDKFAKWCCHCSFFVVEEDATLSLVVPLAPSG